MGIAGTCRLLQMVGALALLLLLSSCFTSDTALLGAGDTPLPNSFYAAAVDAAGNVAIDKSGHEQVTGFEQVGLSYKQSRGTTLVTLRDWDTATHMYAAQFALFDPGKTKPPAIYYGLATIEDSIVTIYTPNEANDPGLRDAMKEAGVEGKGVYSFSTREKLYDGLRVLSQRLSKAGVIRYRIYVNPNQNGQLQADIAAAKAARAAIASQNAAPTPGGQPATSPAAPPLSARALAQLTPVTDPSRLVQDPGADAANSCDQQAANPKDPDRMAAGVGFENIVPRLAQQECERAVAKYPNTARFKYQLGRAYYAGRNFDPAVANFQQAAAAGYPAAFYGLGGAFADGNGVAQDTEMAEQMYRKAAAGGIDTKAEIAEYVFNSEGYSNPQLMQAVYDGRLSAATMKSQSTYWFSFVDLFHNTPDCVRIMSDQTYAKFYMAGQMGTLTGMFGALVQAHRGGTTGDFGAAAESGWNAGRNFTDTMVAGISEAKQDAQLFYDRHGCSSPVAYKFFRNIAVAAARM